MKKIIPLLMIITIFDVTTAKQGWAMLLLTEIAPRVLIKKHLSTNIQKRTLHKKKYEPESPFHTFQVKAKKDLNSNSQYPASDVFHEEFIRTYEEVSKFFGDDGYVAIISTDESGESIISEKIGGTWNSPKIVDFNHPKE